MKLPLALALAVAVSQVAAAETPSPSPAPSPTAPAAPAAPAPAKIEPAASTSAPAAAPIMPDSALMKLIENVRKSPIGSEPNALSYLDLIGTGRANAAQVNDFAAYLGKRVRMPSDGLDDFPAPSASGKIMK